MDRVEGLETSVRRLRDDLTELEDTLARRLDKYRKRMEREPEPAAAPEPAQPAQLQPVEGNRQQRMAELRRSGRWPLKGA